jgi:hypothetical protein
MKRYYRIALSMAFALAVASSCKDDALDPLQVNKIQKGTLLALRGTQLQNVYFKGLPGAEFFPKSADGTETFKFDAEYLATDPNSLQSVDFYVLKKASATSTPERVLVKNVPFSEFKKDGTYRSPWVTVTIPISEILSKLGLPTTFPLGTGTINTLLGTYKNGVAIEGDLNLTNGSIAPASKVVAAGLFQSDQFYPAQKLNYAMTNYCPEDISAKYSFSTIVTAVGAGGAISGCAGGVTGTGEFIALTRGKYSVSDATFGQYDCAWDDSPATGVTITNTCNEITTGGGDQYNLVYTFSNLVVNSAGTTMTFNWSNDYGDAGTTTLTRTDGKTWPTVLFTK